MWTRKWFLETQNKITNSALLRVTLQCLAFYGLVPYFAFGVWLFYSGQIIPFYFLGITASIARFISSPVLETLITRQRPYQKHHFKPQESKFFSRVRRSYDSFPSDHTAFLFSLSLGIALWYPVLGIVSAVLAILVGLSRVALGYHYLSDILGGILVGITSYYITFYFFNNYVLIQTIAP